MPEAGEEVAVMTTSSDVSGGVIVLKFRPDVAPKHVENFKKLAKLGFYDGTRFHRCIADFMIQGGDPNTKDLSKSAMWGTGGFEEEGKRVTVPAEFNTMKHTRGVLSMARSSDPNSASSQFFVMHKTSPHLDGSYSAFGIVVKGMDVVDDIVKTGDAAANGKVQPSDAVKIESVKIKPWPLEGN